MPTYKTFKRSVTNWEQFSKGRKVTEETGLSYETARQRCEEFNKNRNARQIRKGTMLEFTQE